MLVGGARVISVVVFKWKPSPGYRSRYGPAQVHTLRNMVARHYAKPHRFICVTDDPEGLDDGVEVVPLWNDHADIPNPSFKDGPSCYRRLKVFDKGMGDVLGERFVCLDLDIVITGDIAPLLDREEDFIAWKNPNPLWPYNGSMFMMDAGARREVWETFDPEISPALSNAAKCRGSDQGWMSYVLGPGEATWDKSDGVYSLQDEILRRRPLLRLSKLPNEAKIVVFHGAVDPWNAEARKVDWIREHYR
jgi:hypothetical protein